MRILFVKGSKIEYNGDFYELDDLFSNQLFDVCNEMAESYDADLSIVNEVFINRVQPYNAITLFLSGKKIDQICFENPDIRLNSYILDYARKNKIKIKGTPILYKMKKRIYGHINIMLSVVYLILKMIKTPYSNNAISPKSKISLIRTPASRKKLAFLENVELKYENFEDENSIYKCFGRFERLSWVIKSWIASYRELNRYTEYIDRIIGPYSSIEAYAYYSKRVVHTLLYAILLDNFFLNNLGKTYYTGNNLDRFALIEEKVARKYGIMVVCIPHGLEYGFKLPHCFIGDKFFTTSFNTALHLNSIYNTSKFIFDPVIASKMFSINKGMINKSKEIVFFTEPREVEVNFKIINALLLLFKDYNLKLCLKLHPKDKKSDYEKYSKDVKFIHSLDDAITGNVCISRKSTTLLEAIYNGSDAAAIIISSKDEVIFNTLPSLQDKSINKFESVEELYKWILLKIS